MDKFKELSEEIIEALKPNVQPNNVLLLGAQFMYKEQKYGDIIENFKEQLEFDLDRYTDYLGSNQELVNRILNCEL